MWVINLILIGFLSSRKKPDNLKKAYAFAAVSKAEGAEFIYFSPRAVDFENQTIHGYVYREGKWVKTISRFPDVVHNPVGFSSNDRQDDIVSKLREMIPFTTNPIGHKMWVFRRLMEYKEFASYIVPSETVLSFEHFWGMLEKYKELVIKPIVGHQGEGVCFVKKEKDEYVVTHDNTSIKYAFDEFKKMIEDKLKECSHLLQPYINSRTKSGKSYDFRLHVQKNKDAQWVTTKVYPRIAQTNNIVCNLSSGGYTTLLNSFLKEEFGDEASEVNQDLEAFSLQLANHMDKIQKECGKEPLDELGIDIGLDKNKKIWIYEVNYRPGTPPAFYLELDVIKNAIHYAMFLAHQKLNHSNGDIGGA